MVPPAPSAAERSVGPDDDAQVSQARGETCDGATVRAGYHLTVVERASACLVEVSDSEEATTSHGDAHGWLHISRAAIGFVTFCDSISAPNSLDVTDLISSHFITAHPRGVRAVGLVPSALVSRSRRCVRCRCLLAGVVRCARRKQRALRRRPGSRLRTYSGPGSPRTVVTSAWRISVTPKTASKSLPRALWDI